MEGPTIEEGDIFEKILIKNSFITIMIFALFSIYFYSMKQSFCLLLLLLYNKGMGH